MDILPPVPESADDRERRLSERSRQMVAHYTEEVILDSRHLLRPDSRALQNIPPLAALADDDALFLALRRIGTIGDPDALTFVLSHFDRLAVFLTQDTRREECLNILENLGLCWGEQDNRIGAMITDLLLPLLEHSLEDRRFQLLLPTFLNGTPYQRRKVLAILEPCWRQALRPRLGYSSITHAFITAFYSEHEDVRRSTETLLQEILPDDIDAGVVIRAWRDEREGSWHWITDNINCMMELEAERPGQRVLSTLHREFGIAHFGRYQRDLLPSQFDQRGQHLPYGIAAVAYSDHNHAFQDLQYLENLRDEAAKRGIALRIVEYHSGETLIDRLDAMRMRYATGDNPDFIMRCPSRSSTPTAAPTRCILL